MIPVGPATIAGYGAAAGTLTTAGVEGLNSPAGKWLYIVAAALVALTNAGRQWQARTPAEPAPSSRPESARTPEGEPV